MARPKTISVTFRCPENLYNNLSNFALDNNIVKDGKPIISEALIAALVIGLGADGHTDISQNVRQPNNIDFEAIVNNAITPLIARIEALEATANETKAPVINTSEIVGAIELETSPVDTAIAPDTAAPLIEKSLPDDGLSNAIAATGTQTIESLAVKFGIEAKSLSVPTLKKIYIKLVEPSDRTINPQTAKRDQFIKAFKLLGYVETLL